MKNRWRRFQGKNSLLVSGVLALLIVSGACQVKPTKVTETPAPAFTRLQEKTKKPLKLSDETVVLDSRSDFDYGLAHWSSSLHFTWQNLIAETKKPWLLVEPRVAVQRLALLGVEPKTPVLVIGYGQKGNGDEGRLAWTLVYYGMEDVQTVSVDGLDVYFTHQDTPARRNASPWDPNLRSDLVIDRPGFIKAAMSPRKSGKQNIFIIDVRSKEEYFSRNQKDYETPDVRALQIDWHEFYGGDGRPLKTIRRKLQGVGVKSDDTVIVISNHGIRSSAASYALLALGFKHVCNFLGGWDALLGAK